ncbi:MAG: DegV family protein, partial [Acidimicrobiales bacterium]
MAGVRIVSDSACDLSKDEASELGIEVVPLKIRFGDKEFTDREDLSVAEFYRRMSETDALPETSAPAPGAFEHVFRKLAGEGADAVVCINLSGALSATIESARNAARALEGEIDVRVIDSRTLTAGLGTIVLEAAKAARGGSSVDEVV